jgi:hypothetical protein
MAASIALGQWLEYQALRGYGAQANDNLFSSVHAVTVEVDRG